ncbi:hypothetical protein ABER02_19190 [Rossellomorea marisflavi]|uniref:hypothetical protein n=1 Tax=Rossellomorea marisflavi TaxID=189381 RepID=UPI003D2BB78A
MKTRTLAKQFKRDIGASIISAVFLSSSFFFIDYFQFYIVDPPLRFMLSDFIPFILQFGGGYFLLFLFGSLLFSLSLRWVKGRVMRLILYLLVGVLLTPVLFPLDSARFSYTNLYSLSVILSMVIMGVYKEIILNSGRS